MQSRLPPATRFARRFHAWAIDRGFPILISWARRWPRWLLLMNARWVIGVIFAVYRSPRRPIAANLARIMGRSPRSWAVRRARSRMLRHFAMYWVDLFRFSQLPPAAGRALLARVDGLDRVERLHDAGRGVILLTAHVGNWELGGVLLGQRDLPVSVVYVADQFAGAEAFRSRARRAAGVEEIEVRLEDSFSSLPVLRALRDGRVVAMQGDRDLDGEGIVAPLCGAPVRFPRGPFVVALLTGTPIVPTFLTYDERFRFVARFGEPIEVDREGEREAALEGAAVRWSGALEEVLREAPDQWYTFYDYWAAESAEPLVGGRPREVTP